MNIQNMYCEQRKKVYFIHEFYTPTMFMGKLLPLVTSYNIESGYLCIFDEFEKGPSQIFERQEQDDIIPITRRNFLTDVLFDTHSEACKALTKILNIRCSNDMLIREEFDLLVNEYPECVI